MINTNYKKLQNGSDIRGISLTGIPGELPNLTRDEAERIAKAFLLFLKEFTKKDPDQLKIAVGRDPRMSGQHLLHGLLNGFGPYGTTVYDCGIASTPAMFMATRFPEISCDGAIIITASHLPYNRNGFKFFTEKGGLDKSDIAHILDDAESDEKLKALGYPAYNDSWSMILGKKTFPSQKFDLMTIYSSFLKDMIKKGVNSKENYDKPLTGLDIVVDAGNGSGGFYVEKVLTPLGAKTNNSQYLEPDGTFPNHAPNPEDKEAMHSISMKVISKGADLGIIFDTDVDRSAAVDHRGREISRNGIIALAAALIAEDHPGSTVVTDSITSPQLTTFLENNLGLKHLRFKRGYKNVINKAIELNDRGIDCHLAIETSGHAAMKENFFLDDGAYLATKIVIKAALLQRESKTLSNLIDDLKMPAEAKEFRLPVTALDFSSYVDTLIEDLENWQCPGMTKVSPNYEGVRYSFSEGGLTGWFLLRRSLHDPIIPVNVESDQKGGCDIITGKLMGFLKKYDELNLSSMEK